MLFLSFWFSRKYSSITCRNTLDTMYTCYRTYLPHPRCSHIASWPLTQPRRISPQGVKITTYVFLSGFCNGGYIRRVVFLFIFIYSKTVLLYTCRDTYERVDRALNPPRGRDSTSYTSPALISSPGFASAVLQLIICSWSLNPLLSMPETIANRVVSSVTALVGFTQLEAWSAGVECLLSNGNVVVNWGSWEFCVLDPVDRRLRNNLDVILFDMVSDTCQAKGKRLKST